MYQFYYADEKKQLTRGVCKDSIWNHFKITAIRPAMWEEHCLECSAPLCYENCLHYKARSDGRCKRFDNGFLTFQNEKACCGQGAHIKFCKWANMMTIIFPGMLSPNNYQLLFERNQKLGARLKKTADSKLPVKARWELIRTREFLRRRKLRHLAEKAEKPDAFVFHGFSYCEQNYNLIIEVYDDHTPVYKTALPIVSGENLFVLNHTQMSPECWKANNLIKIYPENNIEAELDLLWCDFVVGEPVTCDVPAEKVKCVVWDLDCTLWNGTLIETDDLNGLKLKEGVLEVIQALDERGIIQSIASKNDFDAAWPVVEKLGLADYFLYPQIHWNAKSSSMEQIAKELNIGIDTLALIDDSVFEREQVRSVLPKVRVYDENEILELLNLPEFSVMVTEESKKRRAMYRAEERRNELRSDGNEDTIDFLKKCHLRINLFQPMTDAEILRCYELTVRTNQLNMSGKKYTEEEFSEVLRRPNHKNIAFTCQDDFGEYGVVGFGQYRIEDNQLIFTEFAMSCRVAGKYVESALFTSLLRKEQVQKGKFKIFVTKKNGLLRKTLKEIGFSVEKEISGCIEYFYCDNLLHSELIKVEEYNE